jgi:hypothetical protein
MAVRNTNKTMHDRAKGEKPNVVQQPARGWQEVSAFQAPREGENFLTARSQTSI